MGGVNSVCDVTVQLDQSGTVVRDVAHRVQRAAERRVIDASKHELMLSYMLQLVPVQRVGVALQEVGVALRSEHVLQSVGHLQSHHQRLHLSPQQGAHLLQLPPPHLHLLRGGAYYHTACIIFNSVCVCVCVFVCVCVC